MRTIVVLFLTLTLSGCFIIPLVEPDSQARLNGECQVCEARASLRHNSQVSAAKQKSSKLDKLIRQLNSDKPVDRAHAAYWLGEMSQGAVPAVPTLITALQDSNNWVRRASAKALGKIGDRRALEPLKALKKDKDKFVAETASNAVRNLTNV
jgi:HEAT repeat protein